MPLSVDMTRLGSPRLSTELVNTGLLTAYPQTSGALSGQGIRSGDLASSSSSGGSINAGKHGNESEGQQTSKHQQSRWLSLWSWELLAVTTSVLALIATTAILYAYDDKTLDSWKAPLRPNTVISTLSTLAKSSMLMAIGEGLGQLKWVYFEQRAHRLRDFEIFDEASRGPLGACRLLWRVHWRAFMASVGAAIVLLALAMDPFVQQVISFPQLYVNATVDHALIGGNRVFVLGEADGYPPVDEFSSATSDLIGMHGMDFPTVSTKRTTGMAAAINAGVFGRPLQATYNCASGNCAWDQFTTLAVCSACADVTHSASSSRRCIDEETTGQTPSTFGAPYSTCTYQLAPEWSIDGKSLCSFNPAGRQDFNTRLNASVDGNDALDESTLASIAILAFDDDAHTNDDNHCRSTLKYAQKCSLKWCVKTYATSHVDNATLFDKPTAQEGLRRLTDVVKFNRCHESSSPTGLEDWFVTSSSSVEDEDCPTKEDYRNAFGVADSSASSLKDWVTAVFTTSAGYQGDSDRNSVAEWLNRAESISKIMDDVAGSMTNALRNANATAVKGTSQQRETYIKVHWLWMILPASLILLSILFLAATMVFATEKSQAVWKTSSVATLFHGLQGWSDADVKAVKLKDIDQAAKDMWACLREDERGAWKLARA